MTALIIDDETNAIESLNILLKSYCPQISMIFTAASAENGIELINKEKPDILFLDINMPRLNGIDLLEGIDRTNMDVIIVTAYNEYAIKAIKLAVTDYLLKPVSILELIKVVNAIQAKHEARIAARNEIKEVHEQINNGKLAIQLKEGIQFIEITKIIMIEAIGSYSKLFMTNKSTLVISKNLKQVESILSRYNFFRAHRSFIINLNNIIKYKPLKDGGIIFLTDGIEIELSRTQKNEFNELMEKNNIGKI